VLIGLIINHLEKWPVHRKHSTCKLLSLTVISKDFVSRRLPQTCLSKGKKNGLGITKTRAWNATRILVALSLSFVSCSLLVNQFTSLEAFNDRGSWLKMSPRNQLDWLRFGSGVQLWIWGRGQLLLRVKIKGLLRQRSLFQTDGRAVSYTYTPILRQHLHCAAHFPYSFILSFLHATNNYCLLPAIQLHDSIQGRFIEMKKTYTLKILNFLLFLHGS
jgi:hypothetical protein